MENKTRRITTQDMALRIDRWSVLTDQCILEPFEGIWLSDYVNIKLGGYTQQQSDISMDMN